MLRVMLTFSTNHVQAVTTMEKLLLLCKFNSFYITIKLT